MATIYPRIKAYKTVSAKNKKVDEKATNVVKATANKKTSKVVKTKRDDKTALTVDMQSQGRRFAKQGSGKKYALTKATPISKKMTYEGWLKKGKLEPGEIDTFTEICTKQKFDKRLVPGFDSEYKNVKNIVTSGDKAKIQTLKKKYEDSDIKDFFALADAQSSRNAKEIAKAVMRRKASDMLYKMLQ